MDNSTNKIDQNNSFFGHPAGLKTLFLTEMWERMSYYGMRALLVLFMTATLQDGGMAINTASAVAIYGLYTASVYFMGLPGGWIADRLIGGQRAIWYGGIIIMCGHLTLAIPNNNTFFIGLILVAVGTGLLKPNISALVGQLYQSDDQRRDSGYSIYYMGINIGALIGYFICGYLAENVGWHWAFGAAAIGMGLGLIQYQRTLSNLQGISEKPSVSMNDTSQKRSWQVICLIGLAIIVITGLIMSNRLAINPIVIAKYTAIAFTLLFFIYFAIIFFLGKLSALEKKGMGALLLVCIASACFWSGFEQAGSTLNLFARDYTNLNVLGFAIPPAWFQSVNAIFIIILTPFFAALWINIGRHMTSSAYAIKCAAGLIIMACGFIVMYFAAQIAATGLKVAPFWLIMTYFLHTVGELCLSPIALSAVSKLSPQRHLGQVMGIFILTYSIGSIIAGLFAGNFDPDNVAEMPSLYLQIVIFSVGVGAVVLLLGFITKNWEREVEQQDFKQ